MGKTFCKKHERFYDQGDHCDYCLPATPLEPQIVAIDKVVCSPPKKASGTLTGVEFTTAPVLVMHVAVEPRGVLCGKQGPNEGRTTVSEHVTCVDCVTKRWFEKQHTSPSRMSSAEQVVQEISKYQFPAEYANSGIPLTLETLRSVTVDAVEIRVRAGAHDDPCQVTWTALISNEELLISICDKSAFMRLVEYEVRACAKKAIESYQRTVTTHFPKVYRALRALVTDDTRVWSESFDAARQAARKVLDEVVKPPSAAT